MAIQTQTRVWVLIVLAAGASVAPRLPQRMRGGEPEGPFTGDIRRVGGAASVAGHPGMMVRGVCGGGVELFFASWSVCTLPSAPPSVVCAPVQALCAVDHTLAARVFASLCIDTAVALPRPRTCVHPNTRMQKVRHPFGHGGFTRTLLSPDFVASVLQPDHEPSGEVKVRARFCVCVESPVRARPLHDARV
jgi:hypothetical protein